MRTVLTVALSVLLAGCATRTTYTEGTSLAVGAYLPVEGSLYGCEIASYLSGCRVSVPSNRTVKITRASAHTTRGSGSSSPCQPTTRPSRLSNVSP